MRRSWRRRQERERERVLNKRRKTERLSKIKLWKMENQEKVKGYKNNPCLQLFQALKNALAKDAQFSTYQNTRGKWIAKCSAETYRAIGMGRTEGEAKNQAAWKILPMMETDKYFKTPLTFGFFKRALEVQARRRRKVNKKKKTKRTSCERTRVNKENRKLKTTLNTLTGGSKIL